MVFQAHGQHNQSLKTRISEKAIIGEFMSVTTVAQQLTMTIIKGVMTL